LQLGQSLPECCHLHALPPVQSSKSNSCVVLVRL